MFFTAVLAILLSSIPTVAGEPVTIYAGLLEKVKVELSNGALWEMDKGDCFPIVAYKNSHTKVILQLGGSRFMVSTTQMREVPEKEVPQAVEKYRANLKIYLETSTDEWRENAEKPGTGKPEDAQKPEPKEPAASKPAETKP